MGSLIDLASYESLHAVITAIIESLILNHQAHYIITLIGRKFIHQRTINVRFHLGENREKWDAGETRHAHFSGKTTSKLDFLVMTISIP